MQRQPSATKTADSRNAPAIHGPLKGRHAANGSALKASRLFHHHQALFSHDFGPVLVEASDIQQQQPQYGPYTHTRKNRSQPSKADRKTKFCNISNWRPGQKRKKKHSI
jgi:hypothetical protein